MAEIVDTSISVGTTQARIDTEGSTYWSGTVTNRHATSTIRIGKTGVTSSTGYQLLPGESLTIQAPSTHRGWYAIVASSTATLDRLAMAG